MQSTKWLFLFLSLSTAACGSAEEQLDASGAAATEEPASKCAAITTALNLQKSNGFLGLAGALDVEDTATKEVVRIFVSQSHEDVRENREILGFEVSALVAQGEPGKLFADLDERTNIQLLFLPTFSDACEFGFSPRRLGPHAVLITKEVASTAPNTVVLKPSTTGLGLDGELKITFHGRTMD
jgi:hypothetical protein